MTKYIILTGGTGFIGSHVLEELLKLNKKVILLKRSFSKAGASETATISGSVVKISTGFWLSDQKMR